MLASDMPSDPMQDFWPSSVQPEQQPRPIEMQQEPDFFGLPQLPFSMQTNSFDFPSDIGPVDVHNTAVPMNLMNYTTNQAMQPPLACWEDWIEPWISSCV